MDGTLWGETGYETLRNAANGYGGEDDKLWPWPNEDEIKSDMQAWSYYVDESETISGDYGFASSTDLQQDGVSAVTLTSYIWEYLGNQMPSDIYGEEPTISQVIRITIAVSYTHLRAHET